MFEVKLKNGKSVTIDLYKLSALEVRSMLDREQTAEDGDEILAKALGMSAQELTALPYPDYRRITRHFWKFVSNPLEDEDAEKNSQSESTST